MNISRIVARPTEWSVFRRQAIQIDIFHIAWRSAWQSQNTRKIPGKHIGLVQLYQGKRDHVWRVTRWPSRVTRDTLVFSWYFPGIFLVLLTSSHTSLTASPGIFRALPWYFTSVPWRHYPGIYPGIFFLRAIACATSWDTSCLSCDATGFTNLREKRSDAIRFRSCAR